MTTSAWDAATAPATATPASSGTPVRRRNAASSKQALLTAASALFAERGFDRTTTRDIGERAGLDPTLIARYFGNKAALYLATLRTDFAAEEPGALRDLLQPERMTQLLDRVARRGPGPIFDAALRRHADPVVDSEARAMLSERMVDPLEQRLAGVPDSPDRSSSANNQDARLRAEIITAAFVGVAVSRHSDAFPALAAAPSGLITELLARALGELIPDEPQR